ncbi:hypothetical protein Nepgr_006971 [Nepenthes gracilis]|uniref:Glutaredoxin domain-containing protein n=1 Tax=Nepenthes gracilis TaxID=150966 RepID=A0AAD3XI34_NEPGR|nr:hypothetical protein Nepgr_006971 [Nepenthes gracilis]
MGCSGSKQSGRCRKCSEAPYSPIIRGYSAHVHHPPEKKGDSYHVVALISSTLGSLKLDSSPPKHQNKKGGRIHEDQNGDEDDINGGQMKEFEIGLIEAKVWSKLIEEKITKIVPKTPSMTPPGEPETIDALELMEGLEVTSPLLPAEHLRDLSFHVSPNSIPAFIDSPKTGIKPDYEKDCSSNGNLISTAIVSQFDPEVISGIDKSLQELTPTNSFRSRPFHHDQDQTENNSEKKVGGSMILDLTGEKIINGFAGEKNQKGGKKRLRLYLTSLRGVRKTYEDCCDVKIILKGLGVRFDERDVSMHSGFKEELRDLLGDGFNKGGLPRVFVADSYIGGADEIRQMHEEGRLEKVLEGCQRMVEDGGSEAGGGGAADAVCEACGDIRFVPCETCSGSCKIYYKACEREYDDHDDDQQREHGQYGFYRCPDCNENGLVRCPLCLY